MLRHIKWIRVYLKMDLAIDFLEDNPSRSDVRMSSELSEIERNNCSTPFRGEGGELNSQIDIGDTLDAKHNDRELENIMTNPNSL